MDSEAPQVDLDKQQTVSIPTANKPTSITFTKGFQVHDLSTLLAIHIPMTLIILSLVEASSLLWPPITVVLYFAILLLTLRSQTGGT